MLNSEKSLEIPAILPSILPSQLAAIESILSEKDLKISENESKIQRLENELRWLKEQIQLARQRSFGRSTEKSTVIQSEIIFNEDAEVVASTHEEPVEQITYTRRKTKSTGRKLDTSLLPREKQIHDLTEAEKVCACGHALVKIGEETSEQVDYIPEQLKVIEHVRCKYTCRTCETVKSAAKPVSPLPKCMATANLITDVMIKKYVHHLPLYRQSKLLTQQGFAIPDNTLGNWVMQAAEVLAPLGEALWKQLDNTRYLQVDETPVKVLKPEKQGYMWAYHSGEPGRRFILFEFCLTRASRAVNQRLKNYQGFLQTDGYSGYNGQRAKSTVINIGCWDHARRKFAEVVKINGQNKAGKAGDMLQLISKLYQLEAEAKDKTVAARQQWRQENAKPLLKHLHERLVAIHAPPESALGKAVRYALNQWIYLSTYVEHGEVEISNCWVENLIRPFALGRRNWLFVGNESSGNKSALLYSLIQTCQLNAIDPRRYLIYVLNQAHKLRRKEIDPVTLLPQFINKQLLA